WQSRIAPTLFDFILTMTDGQFSTKRTWTPSSAAKRQISPASNSRKQSATSSKWLKATFDGAKPGIRPVQRRWSPAADEPDNAHHPGRGTTGEKNRTAG